MYNVMWLEAVQMIEEIEEELFLNKLALLPQDNRTQIMKYVRKEDRDRALVGALLPRVMARDICRIPFHKIQIAKSTFGKPFFLTPHDYQ